MKNLLVVSAFLVGCGGGVSDSKRLTELSEDEQTEVCEEFVDDYPEKTVTCTEGGQTVTLKIGFTSADCAADADDVSATCTATVGDIRDCFDAIFALSDAELCSSQMQPAACAKLDGC